MTTADQPADPRRVDGEPRPSDALHDPTTVDGRGAEGYPSLEGIDDFPTESYVLTVNGRRREVVNSWVGESLLYVLRERLGQAGSKNACEQGECGSCSVLLDGSLVASCCVQAADAVGSEIVTVEGLAPEGQLSDVQRAFLDQGAVQCGFCIPGMVVALTDLLDRNVEAGELEMREAISGNLCRCTGYGRIFAAFRQAQQERTHART
jgi:aerobic-type carbon monoxide dehydrogenase small subunit (CoxS/CutS family)